MFYILISFCAGFFASVSRRFVAGTANCLGNSRFLEKVFLFFSFLCYFVPAAIRYGIGQDYFYTYQPNFLYIRDGVKSIYSGELIAYNEIGFNYLNKVIIFFTSDPQWLFAITSFICLILAYKCIYDYSTNKTASVFFLVLGSYYLGSYSLIRQSIAIVMFLYAIRFLVKKSMWKYFGMIFLATTIHSASLIYMPFYFIYNIEWTKQKYLKYAVLIICFFYVFHPICAKIVSFTRFANRLNSDAHAHILLSIVVAMVFLFALMGYKKESKDTLYRIFLNAHFVSVCLIGLSAYLDTIDRIIWSYYYVNFVSIPYFISKANFSRNKKIYVCVIYLFMIVLWAWEHLYYDQFSILPYKTIFG